MRARYIGDPKHDGAGRKTLRLFGIAFPHNQWVSIDGNLAALAKLPGNNHFEVKEGDAPPSPSKPAPISAKSAGPQMVAKGKGRGKKGDEPTAPTPPAPSVSDATDDDLAEPEGADDGFSDLDEDA